MIRHQRPTVADTVSVLWVHGNTYYWLTLQEDDDRVYWNLTFRRQSDPGARILLDPQRGLIIDYWHGVNTVVSDNLKVPIVREIWAEIETQVMVLGHL